jgi:integrase
MQLFDAEGRRLYCTEEERRAFLAAAAKAPREVRTFCGTLHATGCRISEALALTARQVDLSGRVVVFESNSPFWKPSIRQKVRGPQRRAGGNSLAAR